MSYLVNDTDEFLNVSKELTEKEIFRLVFTSDGSYGYYEDIKNLPREIFRREGTNDAWIKKNI